MAVGRAASAVRRELVRVLDVLLPGPAGAPGTAGAPTPKERALAAGALDAAVQRGAALVRACVRVCCAGPGARTGGR